MSELKRLNEELVEVEASLKKIGEVVSTENRDMNEDEIRGFDEAKLKRTSLKSKIATISRLESVDVDEKRGALIPSAVIPTTGSNGKYAKQQKEKAFKAWALGSAKQAVPHEFRGALAQYEIFNQSTFTFDQDACDDELRGDGIVASPYGANTIDGMAAVELNKTRKLTGGLRSVCDVKITSSGAPLPYFYYDDVANAAAAKTKGADIAHTDLVFEKVSTSPSTVATGIYPIPKETLQDSSAPILQEAMSGVAERIDRKQNTDLTTAVLAAAGLGATASSTTAFTWQQLVDLQNSVDLAYNKKRVWIMHQNTLAYIKKMVDDEGNPIFLKSLSEGAPGTLYGEEIIINNDMPQLGAINRKVVLYGDFSNVVVHEVNGVDVQALYELFAKQYAVGIFGTLRYGFAVKLPGTIKYMTTPAE